MKSIKLFGHTYEIREEIDWHDSAACAKIYSGELLIRIDKSLPPTRREEALLHEVIEGINYHLELELEHTKITALSEALHMVLKQNGIWK